MEGGELFSMQSADSTERSRTLLRSRWSWRSGGGNPDLCSFCPAGSVGTVGQGAGEAPCCHGEGVRW